MNILTSTHVFKKPASIDAKLLHKEIKKLNMNYVVTVPDTHQETLLTLLDEDPDIHLITVTTEDEAICINAGLYIGGKKSMLLIQNNGFYASINALRGISLEARIPTFMLVGQYGRDLTIPVHENKTRSVYMLEPTMTTWGTPYYNLTDAEDLHFIEKGYKQSLEERKPVVAIVEAPTC